MSRSQNPFSVRDFRLLWVGEAVSSLGDQFALIALPWLALVMTGSGLALGGVLALMAIPRALLMLIGGVSVDRLSPRIGMALISLASLLSPAVRNLGLEPTVEASSAAASGLEGPVTGVVQAGV